MPKAAVEQKVYELTLLKPAARQIAEEVLRRQLTYIVDRALSGGRERQGWATAGRISFSKGEGETGWLYKSKIKFRRTARRVPAETEQRQFDYIKDVIVSRSASSQGWELEGAEKKEYATVKAMPPKKTDDFADIYGREPHIGIIEAAINTAVSSNFMIRNHCVLYGPPGTGKSRLMEAIIAKCGGPDAVVRFDATSLTQAGAEEEIIAAAKVPRFMFLEEAEKTHPDNLRWMIPVLDQRGELIKTNARVGTIRKEAKILTIATVNDMDLFKGVLAGALASRFIIKLFCPPPDRKTLTKILEKELRQIPNAKPEWIEPALDYCDKYGITDPRDIIGVCTTGQDRLIDGSYQKWLDAVREPSA